MKNQIEQLERDRWIERAEMRKLLDVAGTDQQLLFQSARRVQQQTFGNGIFIRGLIEMTNYCKNDCYYCGIRRSNKSAERYRLTKEDILACCDEGYALGFRTFVLQGGEDPFFSAEDIADIVSGIHGKYPDCAITLSLGEADEVSYKMWFDVGAERYLLRHETASAEHYNKLHPAELTLTSRLKCLECLKAIGYQVGMGFMVGSPFQTLENLLDELELIREFKPHMVGIGPFIPHGQTPFSGEPQGSVEQTLNLLAILRLILPGVLLPATTALGTAKEGGRENGILAGANVVMPNLSPLSVREKYAIYDNKLSTGKEAAEGLELLRQSVQAIGYNLVVDRGDSKI